MGLNDLILIADAATILRGRGIGWPEKELIQALGDGRLVAEGNLYEVSGWEPTLIDDVPKDVRPRRTEIPAADWEAFEPEIELSYLRMKLRDEETKVFSNIKVSRTVIDQLWPATLAKPDDHLDKRERTTLFLMIEALMSLAKINPNTSAAAQRIESELRLIGAPARDVRTIQNQLDLVADARTDREKKSP